MDHPTDLSLLKVGSINTNSVQTSTLELQNAGPITWPGRGSIVNTADGEWELRDQSGAPASGTLRAAMIDWDPPMNEVQFTDNNGVCPDPITIRWIPINNKLVFLEIAGMSFTASRNGEIAIRTNIPPFTRFRNQYFTLPYAGGHRACWKPPIFAQLAIAADMGMNGFTSGQSYSWFTTGVVVSLS